MPLSAKGLTGCDVNKDIEIDGMTQLTLHAMHMTLHKKALRVYVKVKHSMKLNFTNRLL